MRDNAISLLRSVDAKLDQLLANRAAPVPVPVTVSEFAKLARRTPEWVRDQVRAGSIRALPGRPYRIPPEEVRRVLSL